MRTIDPISSSWHQVWHEAEDIGDTAYTGQLKLRAMHDHEMGVGIIAVYIQAYAIQELLEKVAIIGEYRDTIRKAQSIWKRNKGKYLNLAKRENDHDQ